MTKIIRKIKIILVIMYYKIIYGKQFKYTNKLVFRDSFKINISKKGILTIGKDCFFNNYCSINCMEKITIGNNCIFGENIKIYDHNHVFNKQGTVASQGYKTDEITIGNNCWIGSSAIILKGVHIGDNCVIGAGSVITKDIKPNTIVYPNRELIEEPIKR